MLTQKTFIAAHYLLSLIPKCTSLSHLKPLHARLIRAALHLDPFVSGRLVELCALTLPDQMHYARRVFAHAPSPNLFTWNTLIRGYTRAHAARDALLAYRTMRAHGTVPNGYTLGFALQACAHVRVADEAHEVHADAVKLGLAHGSVGLSLMRVYSVCCNVYCARQVFDEMPQRGSGVWGAMVAGYVQNGKPSEALGVFREMQKSGQEVDGFTLASVLGACGALGALNLGRWVHAYIDKYGVDLDVVLATSLVDMYCKCGDVEKARLVFEAMPYKDVMAWSSMIGGLAIHGFGEEAMELFSRMKMAKVRPNSVTFTSVLCACSHAGLVSEGHRQFESMRFEYSIKPEPEHYGCIVDMLCRAGQLHRAHEFVMSMPVKPNAIMWRTLLNACGIHGDIGLSEIITKHLLELEPQRGENYVLVSNVYASLRRWSDVSEIRGLMRHKRAKKFHGFSSIEVGSILHEFVMGDESHPQWKDIYEMLGKIGAKLSAEGHVADTGGVLHDIDEEEKEYALGLHSERLAIAFGLLNVGEGCPIRVVKNLRVCRDCHSVTKIISQVYEREIIIRDRVRFHHFRNGSCSCRDYW